MNTPQQQSQKVVPPIDQPYGAEGMFLLLLRYYLLKPSQSTKDEFVKFCFQVGFRFGEAMLAEFSKDKREWARHFLGYGVYDNIIATHRARVSPEERNRYASLSGALFKDTLWGASPFRGQTRVEIMPLLGRTPEGDDGRWFFKMLIVKRVGEYDPAKGYLLAMPGFNADEAEIFVFDSKDLEFRIPC